MKYHDNDNYSNKIIICKICKTIIVISTNVKSGRRYNNKEMAVMSGPRRTNLRVSDHFDIKHKHPTEMDKYIMVIEK